MKKNIISLIFSIISVVALSQSSQQFTPGGVFDTIYDKDANKFALKDLQIYSEPNSEPTARPTPTQVCNAGYFKLFFELNSTLSASDKSVLCQLFTDLSCFIKSPLSAFPCSITSNTTTVNIYVTDNATGSTGGSASYMLAFPTSPSSPNPGISDNLVWKTIISGVDGYIGVAPPMFLANNFYHAIINVNTTVNWNYNLNLTTLPPGVHDFYTVYLHEALHALGFASQFGANGNSVYGALNNFYSRYDTFLRDKNNVPLLNNLSPLCPNSNMQYIGNPSGNVNPGSCVSNSISGSANCATSVQYVSPTQTVPVYNPICFELGSSLSHFEDICYPTLIPYGDNQYFVMSESSGGPNGGIKRYPREEEKTVLCDIGYSVNATYATPAMSSNYTYSTGACQGLSVWGVNDGVNNNAYTYIVAGTGITIPKAQLLVNDSPNSVLVSCASMVYNIPGINFTQTATDISLSFVPGPNTFCGLALVQYIPKDAAGVAGNLTYVYVYFPCGSCSPPNLCNFVQNKGQEAGGTPGCGGFNSVNVSCWESDKGSPDLFNRNCTISPPLQIGNPISINQYGVTDTYNGIPNNKFTGLQSFLGPPSTIYQEESIKNDLSAPLTPGTAYVLGFWAFNVNKPAYGTKPMVLTFASMPNINFFNTMIYPNALNSILSYTLPASDAGTWKYYTVNFTFTNSANANHKCLLVGVDPVQSSLINNLNLGQGYVLIDDVSILPINVSATLNIPSPVCSGNSISNLAQYASPVAGSFSGPGIINNGGIFDFNAAPNNTLMPGIYNIIFNYTSSTGCQNSTAQSIIIPGILTNTAFCSYNNYTLTSFGYPSGTTYTWLPSGQTTPNITVSGSVNITYTLLTSYSVCPSTTFAPNIIPNTIITSNPGPWCYNQSPQPLGIAIPNYTVPTAITQTWSPSSVNVPVIFTNYTGILNPVYTATTSVSGCTNIASYTATWLPNVVLTVANQPVTYCSNIGTGAIISATAIPSAGITYSWMPGNLTGQSQTVTPSSNTIYTVTVGYSSSCTTSNVVTVNVSSVCCIATNYMASAPATGTYTGSWAINQNVTISSPVTFDNAEFRIAKDVTVTIANGGTLTLLYTHMYACGDMWAGIVVKNGGQVTSPGQVWSPNVGQVYANNSVLIEDAINAVSMDGSVNTSTLLADYNIIMENVVFNRNYNAMTIKNYNQLSTSPFSILNCVITCRNLNVAPGATSWPEPFITLPGLRAITGATNTLASPYNLQNYAPANLKAPYTNQPSYAGVYLENNGTTTSPTSTNPVFTSILIGEKLAPDNDYFNLFDNLMFGIYGLSSNIESQNNTFQNTRRAVVYSPRPNIQGGYGIFTTDSYSTSTNNYLGITHPSGALNSGRINKFYDCYIAVGTVNAFAADLQYADIRSSQTPTNPPANVLAISGNIGFYLRGNRYKAIKINNNKIKNLNYGVHLSNSYGFLNIPSQPSYGQYLGKITINSNEFTPATSTVAIAGNGRISTAIYVAGILATNINSFKEPGADLRIQNNNINRVYRGIQLYGFNYNAYSAFAANNVITLIQDVNNNQQFGISCSNAKANVINTNTITGFSITNTLVTGVYSTMNSINSVQCNSVTNLFTGFEFASYNNGSFWRNNSMQTNRHGLYLSNAGVINQQGNPTSPSDNKWIGTWGGLNYNTFTDAGSFPTSSPLYVRFGSPYFPTFNQNQGSNTSQIYAFGNGLSPASGIFAPCTPSGGGGGGGGCATCKIALLDSIVSDNLTFTVNVAETKEIFKNIAFTDIINDPSLAVASPTLNSFYNTNLPLTRGIYNNIDASFTQGNLNGVATLLAAFSPTTNIENNYKTYYSLLKNYTANGNLTLLEQLNLLILAHQCPFTDGSIIYDARSLYNLINQTVIVYNDANCSKLGFSFKSSSDSLKSNTVEEIDLLAQLINNEANTKQKYKPFVEYNLYPNPAQNMVNINSYFTNETIKIKISDAGGKLLLDKDIDITNNNGKLDLNLINGIYFVEIINKDLKHEFKKLIISK